MADEIRDDFIDAEMADIADVAAGRRETTRKIKASRNPQEIAALKKTLTDRDGLRQIGIKLKRGRSRTGPS